MTKINKNIKKAAKAARENKNILIGLLREDCKNLVKVSKTERDENNNLLTYKDKSEKKEFLMAYTKAKLHFGELAKVGEEGNKIAHLIFGKEAYECSDFRIVEKEYLKKYPERGGFFNVYDYYDYTRKKSPEEKLQEKIAAENSAREEKRIKEVSKTGRHNRRTVIAIAIIVLIAVAAFAVAVYKKGFKTVVKAVAFGGCCVAVIFAFRKAQDAVLDRIHKRFYGNK